MFRWKCVISSCTSNWNAEYADDASNLISRFFLTPSFKCYPKRRIHGPPAERYGGGREGGECFTLGWARHVCMDLAICQHGSLWWDCISFTNPSRTQNAGALAKLVINQHVPFFDGSDERSSQRKLLTAFCEPILLCGKMLDILASLKVRLPLTLTVTFHKMHTVFESFEVKS